MFRLLNYILKYCLYIQLPDRRRQAYSMEPVGLGQFWATWYLDSWWQLTVPCPCWWWPSCSLLGACLPSGCPTQPGGIFPRHDADIALRGWQLQWVVSCSFVVKV